MTNNEINAFLRLIAGKSAEEIRKFIDDELSQPESGLVRLYNEAIYGRDVKDDILKFVLTLREYFDKVGNEAAESAEAAAVSAGNARAAAEDIRSQILFDYVYVLQNASASALNITPNNTTPYPAAEISAMIADMDNAGIYFDKPGVYKFESGIEINRPFAFYLAPGAVIENVFTVNEAELDEDGKPKLGKDAGYLFTVTGVDSFTVSGGEFRRIRDGYGGNYLPDGESIISANSTGIFKFVDSVNVIFENVKFSRNDTGHCIELVNSERVNITGCYFKDFRTGVLFNRKAKNVAVENCDFVNSFVPKKRTIGDKSYGLDGSDQYWAYCAATGWDIYRVVDESVDPPLTEPLPEDSYADGYIIRNCSAKNCQWEAFDCHGGSNVTFDNLDIHNATTAVTCYCDQRPQFADTPKWHNVRISNIYAHNDGIVYTVDDSDPDDLKAVVTDPGFTYPSAVRRLSAFACRALYDRLFANMSFENIRLVNPLFWDDTVINLKGQRDVSIKNMSIEFDNMFGGERFNTGSITYPRYFNRRPCLRFENAHVSIDGLKVRNYNLVSKNVAVCSVICSNISAKNVALVNSAGETDIIKTEPGENGNIIYHITKRDIVRPYTFFQCRRPCRVRGENVTGSFAYYADSVTTEPRPGYAPFDGSLIETGEPIKNNAELLQKWNSDGELLFASGNGLRHNYLTDITTALNVYDTRYQTGEAPERTLIYHEDFRGIKNCIEYVRPYEPYVKGFPPETHEWKDGDLTYTKRETRETEEGEPETVDMVYPLYFPYHFVIPGQAVELQIAQNTVALANNITASTATIQYTNKRIPGSSLVGLKHRFSPNGYEFVVASDVEDESADGSGTLTLNSAYNFSAHPMDAGETLDFYGDYQSTIVADVGRTEYVSGDSDSGDYYIALADVPAGKVTKISLVKTTQVTPTAESESDDDTDTSGSDAGEPETTTPEAYE